MHVPFTSHRTPLLRGANMASTREGRDCERCRRVTRLLLFPRLDARPGPWLLFLMAVCSFVAIRALEMARF